MRHLRAAVLWLIGVAIGTVFLWLALRSIDIPVVFGLVLRSNKSDVIGIVGCAIAFAGVKALRWSWLIRHLHPLSWQRLIGPVFAGIAVNYAVPHGGELVRAWMVASRERLPKAALLASIAVERVFDFCAVLLLSLVALLAGRAVFDALGGFLWMLLAFIVITLSIALPFVLWPVAALRMSRSMLRPVTVSARDRILRNLEHGIEGLGSLQDGHTLTRMLGLSVAQWALMAACVWFSLRAVNIESSPVLALAIQLLLVVGLTLPAAPGHVGTTQVAFLLAAAPFRLGKEDTIAASLVYNVCLPVPLVAIGIAVLLGAYGRKKAVLGTR